jgi:hypothetical protein
VIGWLVTVDAAGKLLLKIALICEDSSVNRSARDQRPRRKR